MPARKYSDATLNKAAELREEGLSISKIAARLGMSPGAVHWHCLRLGADLPDVDTRRPVPPQPMVVQRGNHKVRRFTPDEDRRLVEMDLRGIGVSEMARRLGRKHNSVIGRLMTLARNEAREEAAG